MKFYSFFLTFLLCLLNVEASAALRAASLLATEAPEAISCLQRRVMSTAVRTSLEGFIPDPESQSKSSAIVTEVIFPPEARPIDYYGEAFIGNSHPSIPTYHKITEKDWTDALQRDTHHHELALLSDLPRGLNPLDPKSSQYDRRSKVHHSHLFPHSMHGFVVATFPHDELRMRGTGTMVSERAFVTAAHCVSNYSTENGFSLPKTVHFYSGVQDKRRYHYGVDRVRGVHVHPSYADEVAKYEALKRDMVDAKGDSQKFKALEAELAEVALTVHENDFAIVTLESSLGLETGWGALSIREEAFLTSLPISISGYPAFVGERNIRRKQQNYKMYTMSGTIEDVRPHNIYYVNIDTSGGQSGAGCLFQEGENHFIIGVHTSYVFDPLIGHANRGVRITPEKFDWVRDILERS